MAILAAVVGFGFLGMDIIFANLDRINRRIQYSRTPGTPGLGNTSRTAPIAGS